MSNNICDNYSADDVNQMTNISFLNHYITARFDIQHQGNASNKLEIIEISDSKAAVLTPVWMQKNGFGHSIESARGSISMKIRAVGDGNVIVRLMGQNVVKPHGQRQPFWIDYYKLVVNGKTYIDKCTPLWHDKCYTVTIPVHDNDVIDISAEWQPHDEANHSTRPLVPVDALDNYTTLRIDILNKGNKDRNAIAITTISDNNALIYEPEWFSKEGKGCVIESKNGKLDMVFRCIGDGYLSIDFRSRYNRDASGATIPYWIECQKISINDQEQLASPMTVSHDQAYHLPRPVYDGEIIKLSVSWLPKLTAR